MDMVGLRARRVFRVVTEHEVDLAKRVKDRSYFDSQDEDAPSDGIARVGDLVLEVEKYPGEFFGYSYMSGACVQTSLLGGIAESPDLFAEAKVERFEMPTADGNVADWVDEVTRTVLSVGYGQADLYLFLHETERRLSITTRNDMMSAVSNILCTSYGVTHHEPTAVIVGTIGGQSGSTSIFYAVPPAMVKHQRVGITRLQHGLISTLILALPIAHPTPHPDVDIEALRIAVYDFSLSRVRSAKEGNHAIN